MKREDLVVAKMPGMRLFLAGGSRSSPSFEGPSERTIFFPKDQAEAELKRIRIDPSTVELKPASLEVQIG
jgi:hypothetical protein